MLCSLQESKPGELCCQECGRCIESNDPPERTRVACVGEPVVNRFACIHRQEQIRTEGCKLCGGRTKQVPVYGCAMHGQCSLDLWESAGRMKRQGVEYCKLCDDLTEPQPPGKQIPGTEGHYQGSLCRHGDTVWLATRKGNRIWLWRYVDGVAVDGRRLEINHPLAVRGAEDARLFVYQGKVWVSFSALAGTWQNLEVRIMLAELDGYNVKRVVPLEAPADVEPEGKKGWEKNWTFFDQNSKLHAVYRSQPLVLLEFNREFEAYPYPEQSLCSTAWPFGAIRGGASPILHNGEWYCFFHSTSYSPVWYTMGLYTFDKQDLRPSRMIAKPLLHPTEVRGEKPVVFPCGAIRDGDGWLVSYGANDKEARVIRFSDTELESQLCPV